MKSQDFLSRLPIVDEEILTRCMQAYTLENTGH